MKLHPLHIRVIGLLVFGSVVLGSTWLWYGGDSDSPKEEFKFVYCPNCKLEFVYDAKMVGKSCVRCMPKTFPMKATTESMKSRSTPPRSPEQKRTRLIYIELYVLAAAMFYVLLRSYQSGDEVTYFHFRCPHCDSKLRFKEHQAGSMGQCPRCKKPLVFPTLDSEVD